MLPYAMSRHDIRRAQPRHDRDAAMLLPTRLHDAMPPVASAIARHTPLRYDARTEI